MSILSSVEPGIGRKNTVGNIQALRFFAALVVLVGHAIHEAGDFGYDPLPIGSMAWGFGVDIFFVISGFVMFYVSGDAFGRPGAARRFLFARLKRVVPLYWLFTTLMIVAIVVMGAVVRNGELTPQWVAASYAFLPWPRADGAIQPVLALGWTLNYEMLFYGLFALALVSPRHGRVGLVAALLVMAALHPFVPSEAVQLKAWTNPIILEFLAGMALAALHRRGMRIAPLPACALIVVALAFTPASPESGQRWIMWGGPALAIVGASALTRPLPAGLGRMLGIGGAASYALYLSHPFSINVVALLFGRLGFTSAPAFVATACVVAIVGALAVHFVVEGRIMRLLSARPRTARIVATADS